MLFVIERCLLTGVCLIKFCFEKVKDRFLHVKLQSCDNEFHATKFIYFCITAVCYVKTERNNRWGKARFVLVWFMLFFINRAEAVKKSKVTREIQSSNKVVSQGISMF